MVTVRAYLDGKEINQVPELKEICALDDWMSGLLKWAAVHRPELALNAIFVGEAESLFLRELWIGEVPPFHAEQMGGILKTFVMEKRSPLD